MSKRRRARERMMVIITITIFTLMFIVCSYIEHTYKREATVWINEDSNVVTFIDNCGYEWKAEDVQNVVHGQRVILVMDDHCSANYIKDDIIKKIIPQEIVME